MTHMLSADVQARDRLHLVPEILHGCKENGLQQEKACTSTTSVFGGRSQLKKMERYGNQKHGLATDCWEAKCTTQNVTTVGLLFTKGLPTAADSAHSQGMSVPAHLLVGLLTESCLSEHLSA